MMHPPADRPSDTRSPPPDGDPPVRLEADDARTLAALYDRHAGVLYSLAMRITGEPDDAGAIVQGVLAAAWSAAGGHAGGYAPDVHRLLATTRIRAIDHMRASGALGEAAPSAVGAAGDDVPIGARSGGDVATLHLPVPARAGVADVPGPDDAPRLRAAFRGLPPLERLSIELAYFDGLTISQIATRLEQAPDAANARIRTGLQRLTGSIGAPRMGEPRQDRPPTRELAGLYALGVLNPTERAAFDAHLEVHREAVNEVLSLLPVAQRLAWTAPPHEPPPGLRARIMKTVTGAPLPGRVEPEAAASFRREDADAGGAPPAEFRPEPGGDGGPETAQTAGGSALGEYDGSPRPVDTRDTFEPAEDGSGSERADAAPGSEPENDVDGPAPPVDDTARFAPAPPLQEAIPPMEQTVPTEQGATPAMPKPTPIVRLKGGRWGLLSLAAGGIVVAGSLGVFAARQAGLATALQENLDAANTQARIAELETAAAQRIADELRGGARVLTAADVQTLDLGGQPAAPVARGRLFWSASAGALLTATGLPPTPPGRVYQLWLIPDTTPVSAGLLSVDAQGSVMATVTPPEGVTERVPAAITLEPAGGTQVPGGEVYLLGQP